MNTKKSQKGTFTIEFALGSLLLFLSIFAVFELCRFIFIINLTETALRESARDSRLYEGMRHDVNYQDRFEEMFNQNGKIWHSIVDPKSYSLSINYYQNYGDLVKNKQVNACQDCPLAEYSLTYLYTPMLHLPGSDSRAIQRSMLMVQEHEGWTQ